MARCSYNGFEILENDLSRMSRESVKRIVTAGAQKAVDRMRQNTEKAGHVRSGDMLQSIAMTEYQDWMGGGKREVYPLGTDHRGVRNATKAYVLNYGRGKRRGDKFITGNESADESEIRAAMRAESDRIIDEINGG